MTHLKAFLTHFSSLVVQVIVFRVLVEIWRVSARIWGIVACGAVAGVPSIAKKAFLRHAFAPMLRQPLSVLLSAMAYALSLVYT